MGLNSVIELDRAYNSLTHSLIKWYVHVVLCYNYCVHGDDKSPLTEPLTLYMYCALDCMPHGVYILASFNQHTFRKYD